MLKGTGNVKMDDRASIFTVQAPYVEDKIEGVKILFIHHYQMVVRHEPASLEPNARSSARLPKNES